MILENHGEVSFASWRGKRVVECINGKTLKEERFFGCIIFSTHLD